MNLNKLFKLLIDLAFYLMIPIIVFFPRTILYILLFPEQAVIQANIPYTEEGFGGKAVLFLIIFFALFLLFFFGFYNLRKFSDLLLRNKLFSKKVILRTNKAGQFFTACGLGSLIFIGINSLINNTGEFRITFGTFNFSLLLFLLIVGLLFLLLSDAFARALRLKEENDLTV